MNKEKFDRQVNPGDHVIIFYRNKLGIEGIACGFYVPSESSDYMPPIYPQARCEDGRWTFGPEEVGRPYHQIYSIFKPGDICTKLVEMTV